MWIDHDDCERIIAGTWGEGLGGADMKRVMDKIPACSQQLEAWNKSTFGLVHNKIKQSRHQLQQLQMSDPLYSRMEDH